MIDVKVEDITDQEHTPKKRGRPIREGGVLQAEGYLKGPPDENGERYLHRQVAHKAWPDDENECAGCTRPIFWSDEKTSKYAVIVDHRDHDRANNDIKNLRLLCPECNIRDGKNLPPRELVE